MKKKKKNIQGNTLDIIVIATMSAGKSTVINALIGQELFHSANEATTATITTIHDKDGLTDFSGQAYDFKHNQVESKESISAQDMKEWNANPNIKSIDLVGDVKMLQNDDLEVVLIDTPGPNNSQDDSHSDLTLEVLNNGNYGHILYVLNATQLGVNDDRQFLMTMKEILAQQDNKKEIFFLLNKADCLDPEKGEILSNVVAKANHYLTDIGYKNPIIIPTSAKNALICQKVLNNLSLTRTERRELKTLLRLNDDFIQNMQVTSEIQNKLLQMLRPKKSNSGWVKVANDKLTVSKQSVNNNYVRSGFGILQHLIQQKLKNL